MTLFGISTKRIISADVSALSMPLILVIFLLGLFVSSVKFAYPKISAQLKELNVADERLLTLEQKLNILRQVHDKVLGAADIPLIALPDENPGVWKLSQMATLANENGVIVDQRKVFSQSGAVNNTQATKLTFVVEGTLDATLAFLINIIDSIPVVTIESTKIEGGKDNAKAQVEILVYSAELPKMLPALTAPIKNFTDKEQELLDKLAKLSRPEFTFLDPIGPSERKDPFN